MDAGGRRVRRDVGAGRGGRLVPRAGLLVTDRWIRASTVAAAFGAALSAFAAVSFGLTGRSVLFAVAVVAFAANVAVIALNQRGQ